MRMRRKKHLDERLDAVKDFVIVADKKYTNINIAIQNKCYIDYFSVFNNNNPVNLEIGCGKGGFVAEQAKLKVLENFIAVELLENIIVLAIENASKNEVKNVRFINSGAEYLPRYISDGSINNIYLNFSPPYPENRHENRRLTNDKNVSNYLSFLREGGSVFQRTDDKQFFEYSLEKFTNAGFIVKDVSKEPLKDGYVFTEYEKKFSELDMPIYRLVATKPQKKV